MRKTWFIILVGLLALLASTTYAQAQSAPTAYTPSGTYTVGHGTFTYNWSHTGAASYELWIQDSVYNVLVDTTYSASGYCSSIGCSKSMSTIYLKNGTYTWWVGAKYTGSSVVYWSSAKTFTVNVPPPPAASGLHVLKTNTTSPVAVFNVPSTSNEYRVELRKLSGISVSTKSYLRKDVCDNEYAGYACDITLSGVQDNNSYLVDIISYGPGGVGGSTGSLHFIVDVPNNPVKPTGLKLKAIADGSPTFEWINNSNNQSYELMVAFSDSIIDVRTTTCVTAICTYEWPQTLSPNYYSLQMRGKTSGQFSDYAYMIFQAGPVPVTGLTYLDTIGKFRWNNDFHNQSYYVDIIDQATGQLAATGVTHYCWTDICEGGSLVLDWLPGGRYYDLRVISNAYSHGVSTSMSFFLYSKAESLLATDLYAPKFQYGYQSAVTVSFRRPNNADDVDVEVYDKYGNILNLAGNRVSSVCGTNICYLTFREGIENIMPFDDYKWRIGASNDHRYGIVYSQWQYVDFIPTGSIEGRESGTPTEIASPETTEEATLIPLTPILTDEVPTMTSTPLPTVEMPTVVPTIESTVAAPTFVPTVEVPTIEAPTVTPPETATPLPTVESPAAIVTEAPTVSAP